MKHFILVLAASLAVSIQSAAQTARKFVLPNSADGQSELTAYLPAQPTGRAIVDCPGGGYAHLALDHEGHDWAAYFNRQGIAYFVLKYRMPHGDRTIPLTDAYRAMRTVRDSAAAWGVNPHDVGIMGFSAGGHLASSVSTHAPWASRPDFAILFYPVITMGQGCHGGSKANFLGDGQDDPALTRAWSNETQLRRHLTPPTVILLANDDAAVPPVPNGVAYYSAMRRLGKDCALYIYPSGGHGFGFRPSYAFHDQMLADLTQWLAALPSPRPGARRVACIGNSITDGAGLAMAESQAYPARLQQLLGPDWLVKNFGVSARTLLNKGDHPYMQEPAWRDALDFQPQTVIVKLGTNDSKAHNWQYRADLERDLQQLVDSLKALPTRPAIYLCTPVPTTRLTGRDINDSIITAGVIPVIRKVARKNRLTLIDLHAAFSLADGRQMQRDGVHPTAEGAEQMARIIAPYLKP